MHDVTVTIISSINVLQTGNVGKTSSHLMPKFKQ